jgi:hypothetical protein
MGTRRKACPPAGGFEHGFLSVRVYFEQEASRNYIKSFILAVGKIIGRSIPSLGGS